MESLRTLSERRKLLLAAHRGVNGGNIPCNSLESYLIALSQGADVIELDITVSADRKLYLLHPGMEKVHLGLDIDLSRMTDSEIRPLMLSNQDIVPTLYPIMKFDDVLEILKDKCFINVDKFWSDPEEISRVIRRHGMSEQCIVKSVADGNTVDMLKAYAADLPYMCIIRRPEQLERGLFDRNLRFIGCEILFMKDDEDVVSDRFIDELHGRGLMIWGNAICYNYKDVIAGTHTDDKALLGDPEEGWGWFARRGFDIVQTDWLLACSQYLTAKGYRK